MTFSPVSGEIDIVEQINIIKAFINIYLYIIFI